MLFSACPHCNSSDIVIDRAAGDAVCTNCAVVICDRIIDEEAEWRIFADDDRGSGLSSARAGQDGSDSNGIHGTMIVGGTSSMRKALTKTHMESSFSKIESSTIEYFSTLEALGSSLSLNSRITTCASRIFREAMEKKVYAHVDKLPLIAAVLYIASRVEGFPLWIDYISAISKVSSKTIGQLLKVIRSELSIDIGRVLPELLVPRIGTMLRADSRVIQSSKQACQLITQESIMEGFSPQVVAVAVVLMIMTATGAQVNLTAVLHVLHMCIKSVDRTYVILRPYAKHLLAADLWKIPINLLPTSLIIQWKTETANQKKAVSDVKSTPPTKIGAMKKSERCMQNDFVKEKRVASSAPSNDVKNPQQHFVQRHVHISGSSALRIHQDKVRKQQISQESKAESVLVKSVLSDSDTIRHPTKKQKVAA